MRKKQKVVSEMAGHVVLHENLFREGVLCLTGFWGECGDAGVCARGLKCTSSYRSSPLERSHDGLECAPRRALMCIDIEGGEQWEVLAVFTLSASAATDGGGAHHGHHPL